VRHEDTLTSADNKRHHGVMLTDPACWLWPSTTQLLWAERHGIKCSGRKD